MPPQKHQVIGETLHVATRGEAHDIGVGSAGWFAWLEAHDGFAYSSPEGVFTARGERRARGGRYWRAYRKVGGALGRHYLGRSSGLTSERLRDAARALGGPTVGANTVPIVPGGGVDVAAGGAVWPVHLPAWGAATIFGRETDLAVISRLVGEGRRLITLTGAGGSGKTHLAIAAAAGLQRSGGLPGGAWFVDLAALRDPQLVGPTVGRAFGVREPGPVEAAIGRRAKGRPVCVVLDNCEHVIAGVRGFVPGLQEYPDIAILATSREPLRLVGEQELPVAPLAVHRPGGRTAVGRDNGPAIQLFEASARAVSPDFVITPGEAPAVAELCTRLDGLPLAIQLAASRMKAMTPSGLLSRLGRRIDLEARAHNVPERHRTLRAAIGWSVEQLPAKERVLFRRLAVFAGGWSLDAAATVAGDGADEVADTLLSLMDRSLVARDRDGGSSEPRYRMLETIREYAIGELRGSGELLPTSAHHAAFFRDLARGLERGLFAADAQAMATIRREMDNLRAALGHAIEQRNGMLGLEIASPIRLYWTFSGQVQEGIGWLTHLLQLPGADTSRPLQARSTAALAGMKLRAGEHVAADGLLAEARRLSIAAGDHEALAHVHFLSALNELERRDIAGALRNAAAARRIGALVRQRSWEANGHYIHGLILRDAREPQGADDAFGRALAIHRSEGNAWGAARTLSFRAELAAERGRFGLARGMARDALELYRSLGSTQVDPGCFEVLATVVAHEGRREDAARLIGVVESLTGLPNAPLAGAAAELRRVKDTLEATLGGGQFEALLAEGRRLGAEEAIDFALALAGDPSPARPGRPLTPREQQIAEMVARPMSSREIAAVLVISERTVDSHIDHIRNKLGFRSRIEIAAWVNRPGAQRVG